MQLRKVIGKELGSNESGQVSDVLSKFLVRVEAVENSFLITVVKFMNEVSNL